MIFFWFKEAIKSVRRAKSSFTLTLISLTLAVILIEASIIALQLSEMFQQKLKSNINVNLFIKEPFSQQDVTKYETEIASNKFIKSVKYISKDEAADSCQAMFPHV